MISQKHFPAYLPEKDVPLSKRVSLMLTYEQVVAIASALIALDKLNHRFFTGLHMVEAELALHENIHNACVNCAISIEGYERSDKS